MLFYLIYYHTFSTWTICSKLNARALSDRRERGRERMRRGEVIRRWGRCTVVGERGRGGSTARGLRAEFIPLDKVAPHPPLPSHVGLIPWDKLAEPACLRITLPRYTFRLWPPVVYEPKPFAAPFLRRVSNSRKLATKTVVCFSDFFHLHIFSTNSTYDKLSERANLR